MWELQLNSETNAICLQNTAHRTLALCQDPTLGGDFIFTTFLTTFLTILTTSLSSPVVFFGRGSALHPALHPPVHPSPFATGRLSDALFGERVDGLKGTLSCLFVQRVVSHLPPVR